MHSILKPPNNLPAEKNVEADFLLNVDIYAWIVNNDHLFKGSHFFLWHNFEDLREAMG